MTDVQTGSPLAPERGKAIRAIKILLFSASIIPALVGGAIAASTTRVDLLLFVLATIGLFIGQAGGDYLYYYFTHHHTDARDAHTKIFAGWRPLLTGSLLRPEQTLHAGIVCLAVDLAIALVFVSRLGTGILWFALAGGLVAIFFTPLMLRGLKEPVIFVTFGPLCVVGVSFALSGSISGTAVVASIPVGIFITVVAYLKSARFDVVDQAGDLVVLKLSRTAIIVLLAAGYVSLAAGVIARSLPVWSLAGLISVPLAIGVVQVVQGSSSQVSGYLWATVRSIVVSVIIGLCIAGAFLLSSPLN